jgi:hypothetical protein
MRYPTGNVCLYKAPRGLLETACELRMSLTALVQARGDTESRSFPHDNTVTYR